jgi:hypothetical protein
VTHTKPTANLGPALAAICAAIHDERIPIRSIRADATRYVSVQTDTLPDLEWLARRFGLTNMRTFGAPDLLHTAYTGTWADIDLRIWTTNYREDPQ